MNATNKKRISYYLFANKWFYEPMDFFSVNHSDYIDFIKSKIDNKWKMIRNGIWMNCMYAGQNLPIQGWKIHLSATPINSDKVLCKAAECFIKNKVSFKFLLDKKILRITNSKAWSRSASGKFITAYPLNIDEFKHILEELYVLTRDYKGPYILSDRRYKDSQVLYYRYGGFRLNSRLKANGHFIPVLISPDGNEIPDMRVPYYSVPEWVKDIFPEEKTNNIPGLNNGRYIVEKAIHFSNTGGVYVAHDNIANKKVLLKEARAHIHNVSDNVDTEYMLHKEYCILKKIENCNISPKPFEIFKEWEHTFLAEEFLEDYVSLRDYVAQNSILLETRPTYEKVRDFVRRNVNLLRKLALIIDTLHSSGIVFGDFSINNILINPNTLDLKIVDLEGAYEIGSDKFYCLFTPGFADSRQISGAKPDIASDYYAFGSIMLYLFTHINDILELKPEIPKEILEEIVKDFGVSYEFKRIIDNLLNIDISKRTRPSSLLDEACSKGLTEVGEIKFSKNSSNKTISLNDINNIIHKACCFIKSNIDYQRMDRLFPGDLEVFETNPLSLAHGAIGVMYALNKIDKKIEPEIMNWLRCHEISVSKYPPGLYLGIAGISWGLLEIGNIDEAENIFAKSFNHPLLSTSFDLYYGIAGWGMTNLKFWLVTQKKIYLDNARRAAEILNNSAQKDENGLRWPDNNGNTDIGLAHGSSGIGLFLLYLYLATDGMKYKEMAINALKYDISKGVKMDNGGMTWPKSNESGKILYPYWEYGSAGIGIACIRYFKVFNSIEYFDLIEKIYIDCDRKYTIYPGRNNGLAGIGEFLLDAWTLTNNMKYLNSAYKVAGGLKIFAISDKNGIAFPGNGPRISCDYATGISGIMLFLDRLLTGRKTDFMLDELLTRKTQFTRVFRV